MIKAKHPEATEPNKNQSVLDHFDIDGPFPGNYTEDEALAIAIGKKHGISLDAARQQLAAFRKSKPEPSLTNT